jgi:quercetin dioxygenase-like cupin family protein
MLNKFTLTEKIGQWTEVTSGIRRKWIRTDHLMMVIVEFTSGPSRHPDPFHHHPHEQVSYVAEGSLILFMEGHGQQELKKGDMFAVPSGIPHAVQTLTREVRIIDCFSPIREDFL